MAIDATLIKQLREETGAGVMDVKRALDEHDGNVEEAKKALMSAGFAKADKKSEREIKAGRVFSYIHHSGTVGALVVLGCETDFVAKTDQFQELGREIAMQIASMGGETVEEVLAQEYIRDTKKTIQDLIKEVIAKTGENCTLRDFKRLQV